MRTMLLLDRLVLALLIAVPAPVFAGVEGRTWGAVKGLYRDSPQDSTTQKVGGNPTIAAPYTPYPSGWRFPFCGNWQISCGYGCSAYHQGKDFYAVDWNLPGWSDYGQAVPAPASGYVMYAGWRSGYGNVVEVYAGNGWFYRIAHLSSVGVWASRWVNRGDYLGACGNTGISSGPHIHFAIYFPAAWQNGTIVQIGNNIWGHGMSVPQNGISGQWDLVEWRYYSSGQPCQSR